MVTNKMINLPSFEKCKIAILGLGYVGLPLAIEFAKGRICLSSNIKLSRKVIGFDINKARINELNNNVDKTKEFQKKELENLKEINDSVSSLLDENKISEAKNKNKHSCPQGN